MSYLIEAYAFAVMLLGGFVVYSLVVQGLRGRHEPVTEALPRRDDEPAPEVFAG